jgi:pyruvate ferredoxin oxidoreductase delta subunit
MKKTKKNNKLKSHKEIEQGGLTEPASSKQNKTGSWRSFRPVWNKEKCIQCGLCALYCPDNCILNKNGKRGKTDLEYCKGCGICAQVCPVKAIKMVKEGEKNEKKQ